MIINPQLLEKFYYWLNAQSYRTQSWEKRGIRENAPDEAKKAYAQFLEIEKDMRERDKSGIAVAEYWTHLPPKAEFERKIRDILIEAQERRKSLVDGGAVRQLDYFIEPKDDEDE